jgi:hypothetical protein
MEKFLLFVLVNAILFLTFGGFVLMLVAVNGVIQDEIEMEMVEMQRQDYLVHWGKSISPLQHKHRSTQSIPMTPMP